MELSTVAKTAEKIKTHAQETLSSLPDEATSLVEATKTQIAEGTEKVKESKVVKDLEADIQNKPEKVAAQAGVSALVSAAVFAGMRFYDSYAGKHKQG